MSYTSPITTLPQVLRQPIGIATLASLGVHGLLWAALPSLHAFSQSATDPQQRTVGLVELTPAEQNRLPQAATSQTNTSPVTLPSFAMQPSVLPPLPPPPPSGLLTPPGLLFPLGETPYNYPLKTVLPPRSQALRVPIYQSPQNQQLVPQPKTPIKRPSYELNRSISFNKPYSQRPTDIMQGIKPAPIDDSISSISNNPNRTSSQPSPSPSISPSTSPVPPGSVSTTTSLGNLAGDLSKTMANAGSKELKKMAISPVYPKAACRDKLEGQAFATVEISSTGQIVRSSLTKSTGSPILDRAAQLETRQVTTFKPDSVYAVGINYKYNRGICSSINK